MTKANNKRIAFVTPDFIFSGASRISSVRGNLEEAHMTHSCGEENKIAKRENVGIHLSDVLMYNFSTGSLEHFPNGNLPVHNILFGYVVSGGYSANSNKAIDNRFTSSNVDDDGEENLVVVDIGEFRLKGIVKKIDDVMYDKKNGPQNVVLGQAEILSSFSPRHLDSRKGHFTLGSLFPINSTAGEKLKKVSSSQDYTKLIAPGEDFITFNNQFVTFYRR